MAFHFKRRETVRDSVRRIGRECIDHALGTLRDLTDDTQLEAIHLVRRDIKQLRAVLRLARALSGEKKHHRQMRGLRKAAARLAPARDAQARLNALTELEKHGVKAGRFPLMRSALTQECRQQAGRAPGQGKARAVLKRVGRELKHLPNTKQRWTLIEPALERSYERGQRAFMLAQGQATPENLHEWRKRVKDLWYQLRLLRPIWPKHICAAAGQLEQLGVCLGEDHDLTILAETARGLCQRDDTAEIGALDRAVKARQRKLRAQALDLGAEFYAEKPEHFSGPLRGYWKLWRRRKKRPAEQPVGKEIRRTAG